MDPSGRAAALGDLFHIYGYARSEKASFQWVGAMPNNVDMRSDEVFDPGCDAVVLRAWVVGWPSPVAAGRASRPGSARSSEPAAAASRSASPRSR